MLLKFAVIILVTSSAMFSVWKNSIGFIVPLVSLWGFGFYEGFSSLSIRGLIILSAVHIVVQLILFWYSGKYREANLAFTGAGITGFATAVLASMFFGALLGFFAWWGLIGRLITQPVSIGVKPIAKSFMAGFLKTVYGVVMPGIVSYLLF